MNKILDIFVRYILLILVALPNLYLFYFIFTFITTYSVYFLLDLFYESSMTGNIIHLGNFHIKLIGACIGGSAYYLLLILNLSTPKIKFQKRIKMILIAFASFFVINVIRIFLLSLLFLSGSAWFNLTHELFWYAGSVIFIVGIWFWEVKHYKIKEIPFYSDLKFLWKKIN